MWWGWSRISFSLRDLFGDDFNDFIGVGDTVCGMFDDPRMVKDIGSFKPMIRIGLEKLVDEIFGEGWNMFRNLKVTTFDIIIEVLQ